MLCGAVRSVNGRVCVAGGAGRAQRLFSGAVVLGRAGAGQPGAQDEVELTAEQMEEQLALRKGAAQEQAAQDGPAGAPGATGATGGAAGAPEAADVPWYLREEQTSALSRPIFKAEKPVIPPGSPQGVEPIVDFMVDKLGVDEIKIFDIKDVDLPYQSMSDYMVICTGKSPKHLQKAINELKMFMKRELGIYPDVEGLLKQNSLVRFKRRIKRKNPKARISRDYEFGLGVNSWIIANYDNVSIHMLTSERRAELNLEYLWCKPEEKHLYRKQHMANGFDDAPVDEKEYQHKKVDRHSKRPAYGGLTGSDSVFDGIFRRFYSATAATAATEATEATVRQQLELADLKSFLPLSQDIRADQALATRVLDVIIDDLESLKLSELVDILRAHDSTGARTAGASKYIEFFENSFPLQPDSVNFSQRDKFYTILSLVAPNEVKVDKLSGNLYQQVLCGEKISEAQLNEFIQKLLTNISLNPMETQSQSELNHNFDLKMAELCNVLKIMNYQDCEFELSDETKLNLLRLSTQQHLFSEFTDLKLVSQFDEIVALLFDRAPPSNEAVEFVLISYLKAVNTAEVFRFWNSLLRFSKKDEQSLSCIDSRPWNVLIETVTQYGSKADVEHLLSTEMNQFVKTELVLDESSRASLLQLLQEEDPEQTVYPHLYKLCK